MLRASLLFAAFVLVSPVFRGYVTGAYGAFDELVTHNTTLAYIGAGLLGFGSFLAIRLTSRN